MNKNSFIGWTLIVLIFMGFTFYQSREAKKQISDDKNRRAFLQQLGNMDLPAMLTESSEEEVIQRVSTCLSSYLD